MNFLKKISINIKRIIFILSLLLSISSFSQIIRDYEDVIYLKNGTMVKGVIIEQNINESYIIITAKGDELKLLNSEIEKFRREFSSSEILELESRNSKDTSLSKWLNNFSNPLGYYTEFEGHLGGISAELRIVNGFRFNKVNQVGIGTGFILLPLDPNGGSAVWAVNLNLIYSGDMFDKRFTPYYQAEIGYNIVVGNRMTISKNRDSYPTLENRSFYGKQSFSNGGFSAATVFGAKLKTKKKISYKVGLDFRVRGNFNDVYSIYSEENGEIRKLSEVSKVFNIMTGIGFRFGVGF